MGLANLELDHLLYILIVYTSGITIKCLRHNSFFVRQYNFYVTYS